MNRIGLKTTLLLASSLTVMAGALIAPALPKIAEAFEGLPNVVFLSKLLLSIPALFIAVFSPFAGGIIDRLGKIKPMLITMVLYGIAGSAGLYLNDLYQIIASRALLGLGVAVIMTTATTLIGDYFEGEERMRFLGIQGAFMAFGGTIFVSLSGILADFSWRYPFAVYLTSFLVIVLTLFFLYEPSKETSETDRNRQSASANWNLYFTIYLATFFGMALFYLIPTQLPFLMKEIGVTSASMGSIGLVVATFSAAVTSANYRMLARRLNFRQIYITLFGFAALGLFLVQWVDSIGMTVVTMAIAGIGFGLLMPNASLCLIANSPSSIRGKVIGGLTSAVFLGQFFSPILMEPIVQGYGIKSAYLIGGIGSALLALFFLIRHQQRKNALQPS
jgi:MFS family permease